jgi:uncharacterized protein (TIGR00251 family)
MGKTKWPQAELAQERQANRRGQPPLTTCGMNAGPVRRTTGDTFYAWDGEVLVVNILGKPAAVRDAIGKVHGTQLKVSVTAAPEAGRATDHMLRFLAPLFGVRVADIEVVFGRENVNKQLRIHSPKLLPAALAEAIAAAEVEL